MYLSATNMQWKARLVDYYMKVPKSWREGFWRVGVGVTAISSLLFGFVIWQRPELLMGLPKERMSPIERMAADKSIKERLYEMMQEYFYRNRPYGLMFVSWEEIDSFFGLWVRPADHFPGKSGPHSITADLRVLGGPFLFGECAHTESMAMPGRIMVACPVINDYDVWGYVAAIVEDDPEVISETLRLLGFLAHRATELIY